MRPWPRMFKFQGKYLIAVAGLGGAAVTFQTLNPNFLPSSTNSPLINGVVRSSRALCTITSNVVDYVYSLHGLTQNSEEYLRVASEVHLRSAKRILRLCEANKGVYVKAGQFVAAVRVRKVPKEYSSILSSLQDQAVPCPFESIKEVLIHNLGPNLSDIFFSFDEEPFAAASIAQVHHALLRDHQEVAVKVQYPGLEYQMKFDLATMSFLSKSVAWFFPECRFEWLVLEFKKSITSELDFTEEAKNLERMYKNFKNNSMVRIPHVFWGFTTRNVLTMQFCEGHKVDDLEFLKQMGISPSKVGKALAEALSEMIFVHGFLHGDLHPGNVLVSPEGRNGFSLVLLDFGICKELDEAFRLNYCQLWEALIFKDSNKIQQLGEYFGAGRYSRYFPVIFTGRTIDSKSSLWRGMSAEEKKNLNQELKSLRMEDISSFMESLPNDFLTVLRADGLLRSLISKLGASQRDRLLAYAKYALHGLSLKPDSTSDSAIGAVYFRFKAGIRYIQLRLLFALLDIISWIDNTQHMTAKTFKHLLSSASSAVRYAFP
ncbi:uncharacterized aarF domain-containing protein kinase 1 [Ipomoea triloba]|uniref:uncharacterized aarF domain-containing protein kinase 1 n=1 Tax=Ipomoea triloba TaxID=35885 RepID=UPI00125E484A|nr:uncharacterized aarF domain-containing protein kinase 1 [Ipomoea triloba]